MGLVIVFLVYGFSLLRVLVYGAFYDSPLFMIVLSISLITAFFDWFCGVFSDSLLLSVSLIRAFFDWFSNVVCCFSKFYFSIWKAFFLTFLVFQAHKQHPPLDH